jgi:hypothetical protein
MITNSLRLLELFVVNEKRSLADGPLEGCAHRKVTKCRLARRHD